MNTFILCQKFRKMTFNIELVVKKSAMQNIQLFVVSCSLFLVTSVSAAAQETPASSVSQGAKRFMQVSGNGVDALWPDVEESTDISGGLASFSTTFGDAISSAEGAANETEGGKILKVRVLEETSNIGDAGAGVEILPDAIVQGDNVTMTLRARSISGPGLITAVIQRATEPYEHVVSKELELTPDWKEYTINGMAGLSLDAGEAGVAVLVGYGTQTIELGQFEVRSEANAPAGTVSEPRIQRDENIEDANQDRRSFKSVVSAVNSVIDVDVAQSYSFGNEDIANTAFEPAIRARYNKWEAEVVGKIYYDNDKKADFQPDFTYKLGWISYDPNSFSLFYENFDANRFNPDDGERVSRIERGQLVVGYRFRIDDEITQKWTGLDNHMNCDAETRWIPRFTDLNATDVTGNHKVVLSMDCKYKIMGGLFVRGEALIYPIKGQQQVFDPDFTYGFGYDTDQRNSLALEYENFTPNRYPGHDLDGEGSFKDGVWKLTYHLPF